MEDQYLDASYEDRYEIEDYNQFEENQLTQDNEQPDNDHDFNNDIE